MVTVTVTDASGKVIRSSEQSGYSSKSSSSKSSNSHKQHKSVEERIASGELVRIRTKAGNVLLVRTDHLSDFGQAGKDYQVVKGSSGSTEKYSGSKTELQYEMSHAVSEGYATLKTDAHGNQYLEAKTPQIAEHLVKVLSTGKSAEEYYVKQENDRIYVYEKSRKQTQKTTKPHKEYYYVSLDKATDTALLEKGFDLATIGFPHPEETGATLKGETVSIDIPFYTTSGHVYSAKKILSSPQKTKRITISKAKAEQNIKEYHERRRLRNYEIEYKPADKGRYKMALESVKKGHVGVYYAYGYKNGKLVSEGLITLTPQTSVKQTSEEPTGVIADVFAEENKSNKLFYSGLKQVSPEEARMYKGYLEIKERSGQALNSTINIWKNAKNPLPNNFLYSGLYEIGRDTIITTGELFGDFGKVIATTGENIYQLHVISKLAPTITPSKTHGFSQMLKGAKISTAKTGVNVAVIGGSTILFEGVGKYVGNAVGKTISNSPIAKMVSTQFISTVGMGGYAILSGRDVKRYAVSGFVYGTAGGVLATSLPETLKLVEGKDYIPNTERLMVEKRIYLEKNPIYSSETTTVHRGIMETEGEILVNARHLKLQSPIGKGFKIQSPFEIETITTKAGTTRGLYEFYLFQHGKLEFVSGKELYTQTKSPLLYKSPYYTTGRRFNYIYYPDKQTVNYAFPSENQPIGFYASKEPKPYNIGISESGYSKLIKVSKNIDYFEQYGSRTSLLQYPNKQQLIILGENEKGLMPNYNPFSSKITSIGRLKATGVAKVYLVEDLYPASQTKYTNMPTLKETPYPTSKLPTLKETKTPTFSTSGQQTSPQTGGAGGKMIQLVKTSTIEKIKQIPVLSTEFSPMREVATVKRVITPVILVLGKTNAKISVKERTGVIPKIDMKPVGLAKAITIAETQPVKTATKQAVLSETINIIPNPAPPTTSTLPAPVPPSITIVKEANPPIPFLPEIKTLTLFGDGGFFGSKKRRGGYSPNQRAVWQRSLTGIALSIRGKRRRIYYGLTIR